jgi:lipoate-protein ligase A
MERITFRTDLPQTGLKNMAVDTACLEKAEKSEFPITVIRFYQWSSATVSLGKHQSPERACAIDFCREHNIPVLHRPTGGRAVLHDNELTYSVVSNDPSLFPLSDLMATYRVISNALQKGFSNFGIPVNASTEIKELSGSRRAKKQSPCFSSPTRHELMVQGRKLAGSAQRRLKKSFLQHGSIPLHVDYEFMAAALGTEPKILLTQMIGIDEIIKNSYHLSELISCIQAGFQEIFAEKN